MVGIVVELKTLNKKEWKLCGIVRDREKRVNLFFVENFGIIRVLS